MPCYDRDTFLSKTKPAAMQIFEEYKLADLYEINIDEGVEIFLGGVMSELRFSSHGDLYSTCFKAFLPVFTMTPNGIDNYPQHESEMPHILAKAILQPMQDLGFDFDETDT